MNHVHSNNTKHVLLYLQTKTSNYITTSLLLLINGIKEEVFSTKATVSNFYSVDFLGNFLHVNNR